MNIARRENRLGRSGHIHWPGAAQERPVKRRFFLKMAGAREGRPAGAAAKPPGRAKPVTPLAERCPAGRLFAGFQL